MRVTIDDFSNPSNRQPIVFYDGECIFCSDLVRFLIKHNPRQNLSFATLSSAERLGISSSADVPGGFGSTLLFWQDDRIYAASEAVLKIASHLAYPWKALVVFRVIPVAARDLVYKLVARNRYRFWKHKTSCTPVIDGMKHRFL
jgi:predicted DCC family thiol-disulfide oxidoreductase YuxK